MTAFQTYDDCVDIAKGVSVHISIIKTHTSDLRRFLECVGLASMMLEHKDNSRALAVLSRRVNDPLAIEETQKEIEILLSMGGGIRCQ